MAQTIEKTVTDVAYQVERATNNDGTVDVEIKDVQYHKRDDSIVIQFFTPLGETKNHVFDRPKRADSSYEVVQFANAYIGSFGAIEQLTGMNVKADPESWNVKIPDTRVEAAIKYISSTTEAITTGGLFATEMLLLTGIVGGLLGFVGLPIIAFYSVLSFTELLSIDPTGAMLMWLGSGLVSTMCMWLAERFFSWEP